MTKRVDIFCSKGLGDGLIFFTLAENLYKNGFEVTCYHNFLYELQEWFPHFKIKRASFEGFTFSSLIEDDLIVINGDETPFSVALVKETKGKFKNKSFVLRPTTCKKGGGGDFRFDVTVSMVQNLLNFSTSHLNLKNVSPSIGITPPKKLLFRKETKRVLLHPMSNDPQRNWPAEKFLKLAKKLKEASFHPHFMIAPHERSLWKGDEYPIESCKTISELASYIYESGFLIGNDSGLGHLASALNIPTLILFATKRKEPFWRPGWRVGKTLSPFSCLPNIKGARLQDRYWHKFLSTSRVFKAFLKEFKK